MTPHPPSVRKTADGGRGLIKRPELLAQQLTLREGELHIQCDWHLYVVLILRGRYLSTRNPGPASPVEADHPRMDYHYTTSM